MSQPAADSTSLVGDAAARILRDLADPQTLNKAKDDGWKKPAWTALEDAGLTLAWVPDTLGGAGAGLADGFAVLREAGRFALALPWPRRCSPAGCCRGPAFPLPRAP